MRSVSGRRTPSKSSLSRTGTWPLGSGPPSPAPPFAKPWPTPPRSLIDPSTGASETGDGEAGEDGEDPGAPGRAEPDPVAGGVADSRGVGASEHQAPHRIDDHRDGLVGGDGLEPARHR